MTKTQKRGQSGYLLVIEDDRDIREVVEQVLNDAGYKICLVANGQEALDYLGSAGQKPSLILLDLMLPVMNAWEFRAEQQRHPEFAAIPLVVFSANTKIKEHATTLGAAAFIKKPPDLDQLIRTIDLVTNENTTRHLGS